jgi:hypothetical protein
MGSLKGKHTVAEIEGVRCTVVQAGIAAERRDFLKNILEYNGFTVKTEQEKTKDGSPLETYILGITEITANPAILMYQQKLRRPDGRLLTPAYWEQSPAPADVPYWHLQSL